MRAYATASEAELALALLQANRIDALLAGEPGAAPQEWRLSVPEDQYIQALGHLTDEAESHAGLPQAIRPPGTAQRIAVVLIRAAALFFVVNALLYLAAIGEHVWRGGATPPAPNGSHSGGIQQDFARLAAHALVGGLLLAYAESLARVFCRDHPPRSKRQDRAP
ncbi:MAG: hypothetical protein H0X38_11620 [Planctomycetes bacterium]|nr:hypothetical protein [Planctomycetota bacterium]